MARLIFLTVLLCLSGMASATLEQASGDHVSIRWLAPERFADSRATIVGLYFEVDPGWHVYWRNPGDSGAAPRFDLTSPDAHIGPVQWPFPARLPIAHLTNIGYPGNVAYLFSVTPGSDRDYIQVTADLEWLVCKVDCIPGFARISLGRPQGDTVVWKPADRSLRDTFLAQVPQPGDAGPWAVADPLVQNNGGVDLLLTGAPSTRQQPDVFPLDGAFLNAAEPDVQREGDRLRYRFQQMPGSATPDSTGFVVTDGTQAWRYEQVRVTSSLAPAPPKAPATQPVAWLFVLALAGGVLLNLMPCVFPVLSIKVMSLVQTAPSHRLRESVGYTAGVLVTFLALAGLLLVLRATGSAVGWGFQLQSPAVVLSLIALFWLMALSFWGWLEFGQRIMTMAGSHQGGAFATGVLAVFVATPCTGPFMGVAMGAAVTLPATQALLVFAGLGLGLALPFVVLSASPGLLKRLPKPGPWMVWLQQLLAFPLAATVIWLLWVLDRLLGETGWTAGLLLLLALSFSVWLVHWIPKRFKMIPWLLAALACAGALNAVSGLDKPVSGSADVTLWQPYNAQAIERARAAGRPVFIDFTAAWCITCQVNKKRVLDTEPVLNLFAQHNVLLVRADWTRHNPDITRALAALGRTSVPVYAWYGSGAAEATLLPPLLQPAMIDALFALSPVDNTRLNDH